MCVLVVLFLLFFIMMLEFISFRFYFLDKHTFKLIYRFIVHFNTCTFSSCLSYCLSYNFISLHSWCYPSFLLHFYKHTQPDLAILSASLSTTPVSSITWYVVRHPHVRRWRVGWLPRNPYTSITLNHKSYKYHTWLDRLSHSSLLFETLSQCLVLVKIQWHLEYKIHKTSHTKTRLTFSETYFKHIHKCYVFIINIHFPSDSLNHITIAMSLS